MNKKALPEYFIRVKLPSAGAYPSCPSGDADYAEAYNMAISERMPDGFQLIPQRPNEKWAKDGQGFTLVPIRLVGREDALYAILERLKQVEAQLTRIRNAVKEADTNG